MSIDHPPMKPETRTLTVCPSCRGLPRIVLSGYWLYQWGFKIGDRLMAYHAGTGSLLLKTRTDEEGGNFPASMLPQTPRPVSPSDAIKYRLHPTQVRTPDGRLPKITITGAWLHDWNVKVGNKVSVSKPDDGHILIRVAIFAAQLNEIQSEKKSQEAPIESIKFSREVVRLAGCLVTLFEPYSCLPVVR